MEYARRAKRRPRGYKVCRLPLLLATVLGTAGCGSSVTKSPEARPLPEAAVSAAPVADENWPGWRGHNTSGIADGRSLPTDLSATQIWKVEIPGVGNSSPVI